MATLNQVCVYCGSGAGEDPVYAESARILGRALAAARIRLVYGGGSVGLMGVIARTVLDEGGEVVGIIPRFLEKRERVVPDVSDYPHRLRNPRPAAANGSRTQRRYRQK